MKPRTKPKLWLCIKIWEEKKKDTNYRIIYPSSISFVGFFMSYALSHGVFCTSSVSILLSISCCFFFTSLVFYFILKKSHHLSSFHSYSLKILLVYFDRWLLLFKRFYRLHSASMQNSSTWTQSLLLLLFICNVHNGFVPHVLYIKYIRNLFVEAFFKFSLSQSIQCPRHVVDCTGCIYAISFTCIYTIKSSRIHIISAKTMQWSPWEHSKTWTKTIWKNMKHSF